MSRRQASVLAALSVLLMAIALSAALAGAADEPDSQYDAVATGLDSPRHLDFGGDGALYVAEAGHGGSTCIPEGDSQRCIGQTGAITRVDGLTRQGLGQARLVDDMVSVALDNQYDGVGPHDVAWDDADNLMVIVGLGTDPNVRGEGGPFGALSDNLGQLVQVAANGTWTNVVDVAAYEAAENPDEGEVDSNPYALARVDDGYLVADAGANALLHVADNGDITTVAVFPNRMVEYPPGSGNMMPMQAVPTSVAVGPDGAYYVGQLTGFPFPVGGANVYRIVEGEEPEVYASGFTNIVDIAFDEAGYLYVVEITVNGLLEEDTTGALLRVDEAGHKIVLASRGLNFPGGVAVGDDGYLYVTTWAGQGQAKGEVLRINSQLTAHLPIIASTQ